MIDSGRGKLYLDKQMVRTGEASAALEGGDTTCYITSVPVEAGRQYAAWVFARAEKVSAQRRTTLEVRWQDDEGKWFGGGINTLVPLRQPNRWERLISAVTAPEGAAKAVVLLAVYGLPEGERAWFDDAVFVAVPEKQQGD